MSFYLEKINQIYYFRLRVPKDLIPYLGTNQLRKSLKTKSHADAKTLVRSYLHATEKLFVVIRSNMLTPEQIAEAIAEWKTMYLNNMTTARRLGGHSTFLPMELKGQIQKGEQSLDVKETTEKVIASYIAERERYHENILTSNYETKTVEFAKGLLRKRGLEDDLDATELSILCEYFLKARIDVCDIMISRMKGDYNNPFDSQANQVISTPPSVPIHNKPTKKLSELWKAYKETKRAGERWTRSSEKKYEGVYNILVDILGDIGLHELEDEEISAKLLNSLKLYPKNKNKYVAFKGKPFSVNMSKSKHFSPLGIESVNFILGVMSGLVAFAVKNQKKWGVEVNLFSGQVLPDKRKKSEKRDEYTHEEIESIFNGLSKTRRSVNPHQFWIPLICLYSGMRQNEACQLRVEDITESEGIKVFQICHNPEKQQTTKTKESRICPIHPILEKIGFMEYVEEQRRKKAVWLFSKLTEYEGKRSRQFQKWYNRTFQPKYVSRENTTFHSTRHTFINWFKQNTSFMETLPVLKSIVGHELSELSALAISSSDITNGLYGKEYSVKRKYDLLRKLDYKVDIKQLIK